MTTKVAYLPYRIFREAEEANRLVREAARAAALAEDKLGTQDHEQAPHSLNKAVVRFDDNVQPGEACLKAVGLEGMVEEKQRGQIALYNARPKATRTVRLELDPNAPRGCPVVVMEYLRERTVQLSSSDDF